MGIVILEVCESNPAASLDLEKWESEYPGTSVIRSSCLSECEFCAAHAYVMINGEIVSSHDLDSLSAAIREKIEQELNAWQ
ncbi:DUF1450 domain-containing protein [Effusibacillus dendaii]|uniref:DUF1450 domain-containing protein n=1 Tax=Effusibacillus dendaii TaxID=2743772 RepID=A0A7I8D6M8_9BACL|nr:DUF1450 domain-containing protein [Effusibacillus dendaii]BCJ85764.1 hypothetical protein skT53_07490 [Effusibacillus dendaii]